MPRPCIGTRARIIACKRQAGIRESTEETAARVGKDKGLKVGEPYATICHNCLTSLGNKNVPAASLVRLDPGEIPVAENSKEQLLPLTMLEANLLASHRVMRLCYIIRPWGNEDTVQKQQRGHVIAFPNNSVNELVSLFPLPIDKIPEVMQCIFLTLTSNKEELKKVASKAKALHVRGRQIKLWALHLCKVREEVDKEWRSILSSRSKRYKLNN
jgi:hypothetical protein